MPARFGAAVQLGKRREALIALGYQMQVTVLERRLDRLLVRRLSGVGANLLDRCRTHRVHLLDFLHRAEVLSANNACERARRASVIHRKARGSFRSNWGAPAYADMATVLETAERVDENVFHKLTGLIVLPVMPFVPARQPISAAAITRWIGWDVQGEVTAEEVKKNESTRGFANTANRRKSPN